MERLEDAYEALNVVSPVFEGARFAGTSLRNICDERGQLMFRARQLREQEGEVDDALAALRDLTRDGGDVRESQNVLDVRTLDLVRAVVQHRQVVDEIEKLVGYLNDDIARLRAESDGLMRNVSEFEELVRGGK